jgi:hypothetical protein
MLDVSELQFAEAPVEVKVQAVLVIVVHAGDTSS